jgi:hypothetical protein
MYGVFHPCYLVHFSVELLDSRLDRFSSPRCAAHVHIQAAQEQVPAGLDSHTVVLCRGRQTAEELHILWSWLSNMSVKAKLKNEFSSMTSSFTSFIRNRWQSFA